MYHLTGAMCSNHFSFVSLLIATLAFGGTELQEAKIGVLSAAFLFGYLPKHRAQSELAVSSKAEGEASLRVEVVTPKTRTNSGSGRLSPRNRHVAA